MSVHQSHDDVVKRLKRANGHLAKTIAMIEQARPCADIAQQLQAVVAAVTNAKKILIQDHIDHCLEEQLGPLDRSAKQTLDEFKEISRYL